MKKLFLSIVLSVVLCCTGCASLSNTSTQIADEYTVNIEVIKENAVKLAKVSEFKTCFIRACLGHHIDELPHEIVVTLDKIDELLEKIKDVENMTDCQKGQMSGLWTRLMGLGILEIVTTINPTALMGLGLL